jgi:hypothetical protein
MRCQGLRGSQKSTGTLLATVKRLFVSHLLAAIPVKEHRGLLRSFADVFGGAQARACGRSKRWIDWSLGPQHLGCSPGLRLSDTTTSREGVTHATPSMLQ